LQCRNCCVTAPLDKAEALEPGKSWKSS
jgi:hypothetical protein